MKQILTFLLICLGCIATLAQVQSPIIVQSGAQAWSYTDLQTAVTQAPAGAYIYLPGGSFGGATIDKELHLIGAGFNTDSTNATGTTSAGQITLQATASGSTFEGFYGYFLGTCDNIVFSNISGSFGNYSYYTYYGNYYYRYNGSNLTVKNSSINPSCIGGNNITVKNCVIAEFITVGNNNIISNNRCTSGVAINGTNNSIFNNIMISQVFYNANVANNIFYGSGIVSGSYCNFENNIFTTGSSLDVSVNSSPGSSFSGNISGISLAALFTNLPNPGTVSPADNCHLLTNSVGHNAGTDGTDIGIYGGWYPYIDVVMPQNPHIRTVNVSSYNNPQGNIHIDVKVGAQNN